MMPFNVGRQAFRIKCAFATESWPISTDFVSGQDHLRSNNERAEPPFFNFTL